MKKLLLLLTFLCSSLLFSQKDVKRDSIPAQRIKLFNANYKDFVVINRAIYAITEGDSLIVFDIEEGKIKEAIPKVYSIAKNKKNEIYYIGEKGKIVLTDQTKKKSELGQLNDTFSQILIDKNDDFVILTNKGIFFKNQIYSPLKKCEIYKPAYGQDQNINVFLLPSFSYIDKEQRIWLTYDNGEFGEDIWFFDLKSKQFFEDDYLYLKSKKNRRMDYDSKEYRAQLIDSFPDKIKVLDNKLIYKFPNNLPINYGVKGISENNKGEIFISQSLMHFDVSGGLSIIKETTSPNFYDSFYLEHVLEFGTIKGKNNDFRYLNEYLGATTFNTYDNSFYYYSDKGFFKIIEKDNEYSKEFLFRPWIYWTAGLPNSVGYRMNVIKFEFISEKEMVFLTSNNGIGYFDSKTVTYFK